MIQTTFWTKLTHLFIFCEYYTWDFRFVPSGFDIYWTIYYFWLSTLAKLKSHQTFKLLWFPSNAPSWEFKYYCKCWVTRRYMCYQLWLESLSWLRNSTIWIWRFLYLHYIRCNMFVITNEFLEKVRVKHLVDFYLKNIKPMDFYLKNIKPIKYW